MNLAPITLRQAWSFVLDHHRHLHRPAAGALFAVALLEGPDLVGVAIAGRPARGLQDGRTLEILRCCVLPGHRNGCSMLYRSLVRAGSALGYLRFITYTLELEHGSSLKAAGFVMTGTTKGGQWSTPARKRAPAEQPGRKHRWEVPPA